MSLLLLLGGAGAVDQSGSDTGTGSETAVLEVSQSATDTAAGVDAGSVDASLGGSDSGSGADAALLGVEITASDSGVGADDASVNTGEISAGGAEEGAGADNATLEAAQDASDTGAGADAASLAAALSGAEAGSGADSAYVDKPESAGDTAAGLDSARVTKTPSFGEPGDLGYYVGDVEILYDGVNIVHDVMLEACRFLSSANGRPGSATVRVRDRGHNYGFTAGRTLQARISGLNEWTGYVSEVKRGYFLIDAADPDTRVRYFELSGIDINALFTKRFLRDKVAPTKVQLTTYPADTHDDVILKQYMTDHLDLEGDGLTTALIEHVGTPSLDAEISGAAGWAWGEFMSFLTRNTGAIFYIDPDRRVVLTDVDTPNAPYLLTDRPSAAGELGVRELEIDFGGDNLRNDALMWGVGQGSDTPVFSRVQDAASIAAHGRWQVGSMSQVVWRQATINRIANSYVYGSPQNRRGGKDDAVAAHCVVFSQGIRVGMKATLRSDIWGFEDVLPVRDVELTFPGRSPRWALNLSHEIDAPWSTFEFWFPGFRTPNFDFDFDFDFGFFDPRFDWRFPTLPEFDPCACAEGTEEGAVLDLFERVHGFGVTTGQWGTADIGDAWSTHFSLGGGSIGGGGVSAGYGYLRIEPFAGDNDAWGNLDTTALAGGDFDIVTEVSFWTSSDLSGTQYSFRMAIGIGPVSGTTPASDALIRLHMDALDPGAGLITLLDDGSASASVEINHNVRYKVRWQRNAGDGISRAKFWDAATSEPSAWTVTDAPWAGADADRLTCYVQNQPFDGSDNETVEGRFHEIRGAGGECVPIGELMGMFEATGATRDDFNRAVSPGLGTASNGVTWLMWQSSGTVPETDRYIVNGSEARLSWRQGASSGPLDVTIPMLPGPYSLPFEEVVRFWWDDQGVLAEWDANPSFTDNHLEVLGFGLSNRPSSGSNIGPRANVTLRDDAGVTTLKVFLNRLDATGGTEVLSRAFGTGTKDFSPALLRIRVSTTLLEAKFWFEDETEPSFWESFALSPPVGSNYSHLRLETTRNTGFVNSGFTYVDRIGEPVGGNPCEGAEEGEFQDPPDSHGEETLNEIPTPSGGDPTSTWFETDHQYYSGTERVYLNGLFLRPGVDYLRHPVDRWIEILSSVTINPGDVVTATYAIFLSTPAPEPT